MWTQRLQMWKLSFVMVLIREESRVSFWGLDCVSSTQSVRFHPMLAGTTPACSA